MGYVSPVAAKTCHHGLMEPNKTLSTRPIVLLAENAILLSHSLDYTHTRRIITELAVILFQDSGGLFDGIVYVLLLATLCPQNSSPESNCFSQTHESK